MSSADRLLLILHIGFAIFALGPLTAATMATPRYIRKGDPRVVRYLNRATRIYGLLALGIFLFGAILARGQFSKMWLSASMTLFIVAVVLLVIIERDQRKSLHKLDVADAERRPVAPTPAAPSHVAPAEAGTGETAEAGVGETTGTGTAPGESAPPEAAADTGTTAPGPASGRAPLGEIAKVETGRIATISGVVALIWIVILILMVWNAA
jgi:Ca2+/Na+ antiporter